MLNLEFSLAQTNRQSQIENQNFPRLLYSVQLKKIKLIG